MRFDLTEDFATNGKIDYQFVNDGNLVVIRDNGKFSLPLMCSTSGFLYHGMQYTYDEFKDCYEVNGELHFVKDVVKPNVDPIKKGLISELNEKIDKGEWKSYSQEDINNMFKEV